ncbi:MotE family protein [Azospirillum rugosum]|uniref:Flagellar motility protein MotE (MotC chaperone) n=1 Tax=Azospirillum rugosum TaxID=416170 RepID=A0ABS4SU99_9PROT|nr:flagellar motor switch protein [Azospirillum rugosum]MBP2296007.1 flagellar motility protein MotE (MotC chaperone) [Azospirillum rugosum]MDQ0529597.1 flagellar motility protein MotE (MotC chaperone) [Azospirillum rugosum]
MLRVLPITLVAILMVLPLKLGALMDGFPVIAQQFDREFGKHERPWATDLKGDGTAEPAKDPALAMPPVSIAPPPPVPAEVALATPSCTDPALRAAITEQKADVAARTRHLTEAEAVLAAAETRATAQIQRLGEIKRDVEALMQQRSSLQQEDLKRMVSIYETMKPRDAARIFNDLETDIIIDVLDRMPERRSAPIIAELEDTKAREVTRLVLQRRALPGDRPAPQAAARVQPAAAGFPAASRSVN